MQYPRSFASDNNAGIHPKILASISAANQGQYVSYGSDPFTERALDKFKEHFGPQSETFFVFNGTAANVLGLKALARSHQSILCGEFAHIAVDECGAPESHIGSKLVPIGTHGGKLLPEEVEKHMLGLGDQHHVQPKVLAITQSTEFGTVYSLVELRALSSFCKKHGLYFHMDGARIANAAAHLGVSLTEVTRDVGVDVLSFGGTKNGLMAAEAVVFFKPELAEEFKFIRKQGMQLASKMRFVAAQFETLLTDELWLENARHANNMTQRLYEEVVQIPQVQVLHRPQANGLFVTLPLKIIPELQKEYFFYVIDASQGLVRWMTSFETTEEDITCFLKVLNRSLK